MSFRLEYYKEASQLTIKQDSTLGIMKWGQNNAFPQSLINFIRQSPNAYPAVERTAAFLQGGTFEYDQEIVNPQGLTLRTVIENLAKDYAIFKAFAIHVNYNLRGEVISLTPMRIQDLRFKEFDELNYSSQIGYYYNFGDNSEIDKEITSQVTAGRIKWIDRFNPDKDVVMSQIKNTEGGISNYQGQILYFSEEGNSCYPIPPLQAQINFVLSDIENSILSRKETNSGFLDSYILKTTMKDDSPAVDAIKEKLSLAQGANGVGKIVVITDLTPEEVDKNMLEKIGMGDNRGIIESIERMNELCKKQITGAYLIPPILAGADHKTGFSAPDLVSAYYVFNSHTEKGRLNIESEVNRILSVSNLKSKVKKIKLNKLKLDELEAKEIGEKQKEVKPNEEKDKKDETKPAR